MKNRTLTPREFFSKLHQENPPELIQEVFNKLCQEHRLKKKVNELQVKYDKIDKLVARIDFLEKKLEG